MKRIITLLFFGLVYISWQTIVRCTCEQIYWEHECNEAQCFWMNDFCIQISCENRQSKTDCQKVSYTSDWNYNCQWVDDKCYNMDTYNCTSCQNSTICEVDNESNCVIKDSLDRKNCSDFSSNTCSQSQLIPNIHYQKCEKSGHSCSSVTYDTKCADILTSTACNALGCQWNSNITDITNKTNSTNTTITQCQPIDCLAKNQTSCTWAISANRTFTFCSWNTTRGFCQEAPLSTINASLIFNNISSCSIDSQFIYHFDNSTGINICQACVDPASLSFMQMINLYFIYFIFILY